MRSLSNSSGRALVLLGLVAVLIVAWWWPGLSGRGSQLDIVIVSGESSSEDVDVLSRRLREEGFRTDWQVVTADGCPTMLDVESPKKIVVLLSSLGNCSNTQLVSSIENLVETVGPGRVYAVVSWRTESDSEPISNLDEFGAVVLDPRRLIGDPKRPQPCLWWDDCPASGSVETVKDGRLTDAGRERVARFVVSGVL